MWRLGLPEAILKSKPTNFTAYEDNRLDATEMILSLNQIEVIVDLYLCFANMNAQVNRRVLGLLPSGDCHFQGLRGYYVRLCELNKASVHCAAGTSLRHVVELEKLERWGL